jgi:hypothetical protein
MWLQPSAVIAGAWSVSARVARGTHMDVDSLQQRREWLASPDAYERALGACLLDGQQVIAAQHLMHAIEAATACAGVEYFIAMGSALGCLRHEGHIPWDPDVDVGMMAEDAAALAAHEPAQALLARMGCAMEAVGNGNYRIRVIGSMGADVCTYRRDGLYMHLTVPWGYTAGFSDVPADYIFPLVRRRWCGMDVSAPRGIEELVPRMYGPGWDRAVINHDAHCVVSAEERAVRADPARFETYVPRLTALRVPIMAPAPFWTSAYSGLPLLPPAPSPLATHVIQALPQALVRVVDVGCGTLRDTLAFAAQAACEAVFGLDPYSPPVPPASMVPGAHKVTLCREGVEADLCAAAVDALRGATLVYCRFFAHAVPWVTFESFLLRASACVSAGCTLVLEARSAADPHTPTDHFRAPVEPEALLALLRRAGWRVEHQVHGRGLAAAVGSDGRVDDPVIIRVQARRATDEAQQ